MKKFRVMGTRYDGCEWTHEDFDVIIYGESKEAIMEKYSGLQPDMDTIVINYIEELKVDSNE